MGDLSFWSLLAYTLCYLKSLHLFPYLPSFLLEFLHFIPSALQETQEILKDLYDSFHLWNPLINTDSDSNEDNTSDHDIPDTINADSISQTDTSEGPLRRSTRQDQTSTLLKTLYYITIVCYTS